MADQVVGHRSYWEGRAGEIRSNGVLPIAALHDLRGTLIEPYHAFRIEQYPRFLSFLVL